MRSRVRCINLAIVVSIAGCEGLGPTEVAVPRVNGLIQGVTTETVVATGDSLHVRSVIYNRGDQLLRLSIATCGRLLDGSEIEFALINICADPWQTLELAPGDSNVHLEHREVISPPGEYELVVQHFYHANGWTYSLLIVVSEPPTGA